MIRFCVVDESPSRRAALRDALTRYAHQVHFDNLSVTGFSTCGELSASCDRVRAGYYDLVLCHLDDNLRRKPRSEGNSTPLLSPLEQLEALREAHPGLPLVLVSSHAEIAMVAYDIGADFLMIPASQEAMRNVLRRALGNVATKLQAHIALRSASKIDNIAIDDIQFVESSKRGPIVHLSSGETIGARGTLRALYDKLAPIAYTMQGEALVSEGESPDRRHPFTMAGNSFIVNLDNVRASGKGALVFSDGETIIVPTRKRKDVEAALAAYRTK